MPRHLCISVAFLDPLFHGKGDRGKPEWPPSPLRLFQALLAGSRTGCRNRDWSEDKANAFRWLEQQPAPHIIAPAVTLNAPCLYYVPNNDGDKKQDRQDRLVGKTAYPHRMLEGHTVHYLWPLDDQQSTMALPHAQVLSREARHLLALGWGIDQAVGDGRVLSESEARALSGTRWRPSLGGSNVGSPLRVPATGTFVDLEHVYDSFVRSVNGLQYARPAKPKNFERVHYVPPNSLQQRPRAIFELRHDDGSFCTYSQRKLVHIAGMVRYLAKEAMLASPPRGVGDDWVERYVVGHRDPKATEHRQLSYLPLPSVGHFHADHAVRRVMIVAPVGDDAWLEHLARRLAGSQLNAENGTEFDEKGPPTLVRVYRDKVAACYTRSASAWASVTPVILPGHDDHKPKKTRKLIEAALAQSGIEQPCTFEWSAFSRFRKAHSAHKYGKDGRLQGYIRPDHLLTQTAVHLTLRFHDGSADMNPVAVPGPLAIGAGRHCGLGLFAAEP